MSTLNSKDKRIYFITGGGTGGHIYPAMAIADALRKEEDTEKIYYIGNPKNLEKTIADKAGYPFLNVNITGMPRKLSFKLVKWIFCLGFSTLKSIFYILKYKPDLVFGTGGYVSAPALFAAVITKTPFVIHDCDAVPGIVSKTVAPYAKSVSLAFENSKSCVRTGSVFCNGNPIREEFLKLNKQEARKVIGIGDKFTIVVMGGSQGARRINSALINSLKNLFANYDVQILHQTGKKNFDDTIKELESIYPEYKDNKNYIVRPYFEDMYIPLLASDVAVSRSGSLSLSEICISGLASILVPYPYAAADHQRKNAREMEGQGASLYLEDAECNAHNLSLMIEELINDTEKLVCLQTNAKRLAKPDAVKNIINQIKCALSK